MCPFTLCMNNNLGQQLTKAPLAAAILGRVGGGYSTNFLWGGSAPTQASHIL